MKKNYFELEIKLVILMQEDILTVNGSNEVNNDSHDVDGDDPYGDF
ncbi:MAG: hypothetical protein J6K86_00620 [Clostridia bacterium]|nr:hypothetical protein [Clostridia bacterium]